MGTSEAPLVSIVTPSYNAARFIEQTIDCVRRQSVAEWEHLIVDDCSRDDTIALVRRAAEQDPRIRWKQMQVNSGPGPTRNAAIAMARGRFLAFVDADDLWDHDKLERQLAFMRSGQHAFTYTSYRVISEDGQVLGHVGRVPPFQDYTDMLKDTAVGCLTVMIDRERAPPVHFPSLRTGQDGAGWLAILRAGVRAHGMQDELASYRIVRTSNTRNKWKSARGVWKLLRETEQLSVPASAWYFAHYAWNAARKTVATRGW